MSEVRYCKDEDEQYRIYNNYIFNHVYGVQKSYKKALNAFKEIFPNVYESKQMVRKLQHNIINHDNSKYDKENEFWQYAAKFFPIEGTDSNSKDVNDSFELAWLHHVNNSPHHPAHWVLYNEFEVKIFDMPDIYIIEMLCDWMAMSEYYNSTTLEYWESAPAQMLPMSEHTRTKVKEFMDWMLKNNMHTLW